MCHPEPVAQSLLVTLGEQEQETPQRSIVTNRDWTATDSAIKRSQAPMSTCPPDCLAQLPQGYLVSFSCPCASNDEKLITTQLFCRRSTEQRGRDRPQFCASKMKCLSAHALVCSLARNWLQKARVLWIFAPNLKLNCAGYALSSRIHVLGHARDQWVDVARLR